MDRSDLPEVLVVNTTRPHWTIAKWALWTVAMLAALYLLIVTLAWFFMPDNLAPGM